MQISTDRLRLHPASDLADLSSLLEAFNSNPDFIEASEPFTGKRAYTPDDIEMYMWQESSREHSHCLAIELRDTGAVIGTAALQVPNLDDGYPWIGLLVIARPWQRQGMGKEAVAAIEGWLAAQGWREVRLNVLRTNRDARGFWTRCGYQVIGDEQDRDGRPVLLMSKPLKR